MVNWRTTVLYQDEWPNEEWVHFNNINKDNLTAALVAAWTTGANNTNLLSIRDADDISPKGSFEIIMERPWADAPDTMQEITILVEPRAQGEEPV